MQERLNQMEVSNWLKRHMMNISKQLGIKCVEEEDKLFDLLSHIENRRPKKLSPPSANSTTPSKRGERELKALVAFRVGFKRESSNGGRNKDKRVSTDTQ